MSGEHGYTYGYDYSQPSGGYNQNQNYGYGSSPSMTTQTGNTTSSYTYAASQQPASQFQPDNMAANLFNNPAAQIGMQFGTQAFSAGQQYVNSNINRWISIPLLREYFNVNNSYVFKKIALILFPFLQKNWQRSYKQNSNTGQIEGFLSPREDVNATDLYIPSTYAHQNTISALLTFLVMALLSYIILVGLSMGLHNTFHPEVLGVTTTGCIMSVFVEVVLIKLGCYVLNIGNEIHFLDFFSFSGYKFCFLILALCAGALGRLIKYGFFIFFAISYGFFLVRSLKPVFLPENSDALILNQRRKRINFLLSVVGSELVVSYLLLK